MTTLIPKFDLKDGGLTPTGAINRPINDKLAEMVSVKDFGAIGDGTTDDTAFIQAALNTGKTIYLPAGTYLLSATLSPADTSSLVGEGPSVTFLKYAANVHGITFPKLSSLRQQKVFSGFSMITNTNATTAKYAFYFQGTDITLPTTTYCLGYTFRDIQINTGTGQFAGGFRVKDAFRTLINNVGMTSGDRGVYLEGQAVQTSVVNFIMNADGGTNQFGTSFGDSVGMLANASTDYFGGATNVPEGVYVLNSSFVSNVTGFYGGGLNCVVENCEFDLYKGGVGAYLTVFGTPVIFRNNWVSPYPGNSNHGIPGSTSGVIGIWTRTSTFQNESTLIDGNTIYAAGALPNGGQAICVGDAGFSPYITTRGTVISNNLIKSPLSAGSQWTNGIQVDRCQAVRITNNTVYSEGATSSCTGQAINATNQIYTYCTGNDCGVGTMAFSVGGTGFGTVSDNRCASFTITGPTPGANWNLVRNLSY